MEYPRLVFICPGKSTCNGGTYDHELVQDAQNHKAAIAAGYFDTIPEALESSKTVKESIAPDEKPTDEKPAAKRGRPAKEQE